MAHTFFDSYRSPRFNRNDLMNSLNDLCDKTPFYCGTSGGSANAQTLTTAISFTPLSNSSLSFKAGATNTGNMTIAINGGSARTVRLENGSQVPAGSVILNRYYKIWDDGTDYLLVNPSSELKSYTPTATNVANVATTSAYPANYIVVTNMCDVFGKIDVDVTSASTFTQFRLSLPITSDLVNDYDLIGSLTIEAVSTSFTLPIRADTTNNQALVTGFWGAISANSATYYRYSYKIA